MAAYGYSYVSEQGFVAFQDAIDSGAWRDLEIKPFRVDEPIPKKGGLLSAPKNVTWKLSIAWALAELTQAIGTVTSDEMLKLDQAWDASQRRLSLQVSLGEESESPEERDAAGRVRAALLSGAGLSQTSLSWDKQVDYGRNQVRLATSQPLSSDVELLGLRAVLEDVKSKTNALAVGLGHGDNKAAAPRARRIRDALVECRKTFNRVHEDIVFHRAHTPQGKEADLLDQLLAPFSALLDRYPPGEAKPGGAPVPAQAEVPPTP